MSRITGVIVALATAAAVLTGSIAGAEPARQHASPAVRPAAIQRRPLAWEGSGGRGAPPDPACASSPDGEG